MIPQTLWIWLINELLKGKDYNPIADICTAMQAIQFSNLLNNQYNNDERWGTAWPPILPGNLYNPFPPIMREDAGFYWHVAQIDKILR